MLVIQWDILTLAVTLIHMVIAVWFAITLCEHRDTTLRWALELIKLALPVF